MKFFKKKEMNTERTDKGIKRLKLFCNVLFFLFLFTLIINMAVSRKGLYYLSWNHIIKSSQIDADLLSPYIEAGFTEDESMDFIKCNSLKKFTAEVMSDRYYSIFHNVSEFIYNRENGTKEVSKILSEEMTRANVTVSDAVFKELVNYTLDITGISSMLASENPNIYRNYLFNSENLTEETITDISGISSVTEVSFFTVVIFFVMYVIAVVVLWLIGRKDPKRAYYLCDTMFCPSILILGLSIGEVFGFQEHIITKYVFEIGIIVGLLGVILSVPVFYLLKHSAENTDTEY